jgi:hypothetical protein
MRSCRVSYITIMAILRMAKYAARKTMLRPASAPQPTFDQRNRRVSWGVVNRPSLRPCRMAWWRRFSALRERVRMSTSR